MSSDSTSYHLQESTHSGSTPESTHEWYQYTAAAASLAASRGPPLTTYATAVGSENTASDGENAPVPPAQIAAAYDKMDAAIKESIDSTNRNCNDAPLPPAQITAAVDDTDQDKVTREGKFELAGDDDDDTPLPADIMTARAEKTGNKKDDEKNKPLPQPQVQRDVQIAQRPPVLQTSESSVSAPHSDSTVSVSPHHEVLEATIVTDELLEATIVKDDPWWKRNQKCIGAGMTFVIGALAATVGVLVVTQSNPNTSNEDAGFVSGVRGGVKGLPTLSPASSSTSSSGPLTISPTSFTLNTTLSTISTVAVDSSTLSAVPPTISPTSSTLNTKLPTVSPVRSPTSSPAFLTISPVSSTPTTKLPTLSPMGEKFEAITDIWLWHYWVCPEEYHPAPTSGGLSGDLNQGAGGKDIFLCLSKNGQGNPITNIKLQQHENCGPGWSVAPSSGALSGDLNQSAGGKDIFLCFTTNIEEGSPIVDIILDTYQAPLKRQPLKPDGLSGDLNQSAGGKDIFLDIRVQTGDE
mmetsp:Transcript_12893/g.21055  ORF Transcript_12893/g.21055 Transcript_12893/m.21055 type:complete len:522 (-) Transcript_12893:222-1787(-)|eukprot:CAMPEP_0196135284 /NCGR_PEP_ID=MMETSP0910-20130528/3975_1 /TAXON_ID=49265 /ORGANISM="Thalassiosira rotula, Strain GSO102" /LENGTH=521 /DNA_ID=CAMNT_0041395403 /DNA_START=117 /DNA_END=1682 /DNA_ORIENTATION=+